MLKDEYTGNPRWGQNVIDKVTLMIFVPVLAFKRCFEVRFVIFQVNKYSSYILCWQVENIEKKHSYRATKIVTLSRRFFACTEL